MSQATLRVLAIGGGLGGLCLAQGLRQAGVEVAVYERDVALAVRPQGHRIHLDTRGEQALRECLPPALFELFLATRGQPSTGVTRFSFVDGQLKEGVTLPFPAGGSDEFVTAGSAVDRLTLHQILLAGLDEAMHFGKTFIRYEQHEDGRVSAFFADGTSATGDVLVAADGVGSPVRQQFLSHAEVLETDVRWLGGKTLLTDAITPLLPARLHETFASVAGSHPSMMLGCVWFRTPPTEAAAQFWPGLRFHHTADYLMWGLLGSRDQFPTPDEHLQAMESADLQRVAGELTQVWYPPLAPLTQQAVQVPTARCATPAGWLIA
jgi:2-polyprenyl-6-methoxyphenol hydroxylase-like FAD-dependent oxidoreductase